MDKHKIFWTIAAVAMTGAVASNFFHEHNDSLTCKLFHSNQFALATGLVISRAFCLYID